MSTPRRGDFKLRAGRGLAGAGVWRGMRGPRCKERGYSYFFYADGWSETVAIRFDEDERVHGWVSWRDTPWWDPGGCAWKCAFDELQWRSFVERQVDRQHHQMGHTHHHAGGLDHLRDMDNHTD